MHPDTRKLIPAALMLAAAPFVTALAITASTPNPKVDHPRLEEFGFCIDPATDSEVERCGGLPWTIDMDAFREFGITKE